MSSKTDSLSTQQWAELQRLFDRAMELPAAQRAELLDTECDGDDRLRKQVDALILAADADEELVGDLIRTAADQVLETNQRTRARIGSFKIVDTIGTGGMGMVYLGQRIDAEYEQQVAIKVLHDGLESEGALLRFRAERQILADLNHPNIARLLDGGQTEDGRPYIVMEYIDGIPLVQYCDQRRLDIDARLDLFRQVCSAVATAHRSLVVHRDLKPSNILVDESGVPKLLDFGIAKVLNNRFAQEDLAETQLGDRLLTPDYASPEQVQGQPITTASDIYSLGVLLFQLLAGTRPFRLVDKSPAEMERIVLHAMPTPPSRALGTLKGRDDSARAIAADRRNTNGDKLSRKLAGELDAMVLMALRKEPQRRYASVGQFAADIQRYQQGLPILAASDSRGYLLRKFVHRHRVPLAAAMLVLVSLLSFSVMTYRQAQALAVEKDVSENALEFLSEVFESSTPGALEKEQVTALDILDVGAARVEEELANQPAPRARLQRIIGLAYASNLQSEKAFEQLERARATYTDFYGPDHPYTADVLQNLGRMYRDRGDSAAALPLFEESLAIYQNSVSDTFFRNDRIKGYHAARNARHDVAITERQLGNFVMAERLVRDNIALVDKQGTDERYVEELPYRYSFLANLLQVKGDTESADQALRTAVELSIANTGDDSLLTATMYESYAEFKHGIDSLAEAEQLYQKVIKIRTGKMAESADGIRMIRGLIGRLRRDQGRYDEAHAVLSRVIEVDRKNFGSPLPYNSGRTLCELSRVKRALGLYTEAQALLDEAEKLYLRSSDPGSAMFAEVLREQGNVAVAVGDPERALARFDQAVTLLRGLYGDNYWQTAANVAEQSEAYMALGQYTQAHEALNAALPVLEAKLGSHHRLSRAARERLQRVLAAMEEKENRHGSPALSASPVSDGQSP